MKHGFFTKALTLGLTAVMLLLLAIPAMADVVDKNTGIGSGDIKFNKRLTMDSEDVITPNATFTFAVSVPANDIEATADTPAIMKGIMSEDGTKPSVSDAVFANTDTHAGQVFVDKEVSVNFEGITFKKPGVYRYIITENDPSVTGVSIDTTNPRYLDVYVEDKAGDGILSIMGSVLHTNATGAIGNASEDPDNPNKNKDGGFFNSYGTQDVTLTKKVTGNQGDRTKLFKFIVTITNGPADGQLKVTGTNANEGSNGTTIDLDDTGAATVNYYLKSGESIKIVGLPAGTKFKFEEDLTDGEGYTTDLFIDGSETKTTMGGTNNRTAPEATADAIDDAYEYVNDRSGTVPTGILMDVAPYVMLVAIAGAALLMLLGKRKASVR